MRIRKSTQIAVGAVLLGALVMVGYRFVADRMLGNTSFSNLEPRKINLVGIDLDNGYAIRVANQVAQLVEAKDQKFGGNETESEGATEGANAKRIPIKDLFASLQGDEDALGHLIMVMNDRSENDSWPTVRVSWSESDIRKALAGDPKLQAKLESDINMKLDGTPLPKIRISSFQNGIMVSSDVPVEVLVGGARKHLLGHIETPYRPMLMSAVDRRLQEKSNITDAMIAGYYGEEASKIMQGQVSKENVRGALTALVDPEQLKPLAERPARILNSAKVIVNDQFIDDASYEEAGQSGKDMLYDLKLDLSDEGRRRLWAFSRGRVNKQLLLISNGVAIAAPRIKHELWNSELTITQMHDKTLLDDLVSTLKAEKKK